MLTVLNREERVAPLESSVEDLAGRLLMNYADGAKHEDAEEIKITSKSLLDKSDAQQVCNDVASDGIFQSVTCEESDKDKDKLSKGRQATERVEKGGGGVEPYPEVLALFHRVQIPRIGLFLLQIMLFVYFSESLSTS